MKRKISIEMIKLMRSSFYQLYGVIKKSLWRIEKEEKLSQCQNERLQGSKHCLHYMDFLVVANQRGRK